MRLYDGGLTLILILVIIAGIGIASAKILKQDDGPVEEAMEQVIESNTGFSVDLTPFSPEEKNHG